MNNTASEIRKVSNKASVEKSKKYDLEREKYLKDVELKARELFPTTLSSVLEKIEKCAENGARECEAS